jgi:hypothetical protein
MVESNTKIDESTPLFEQDDTDEIEEDVYRNLKEQTEDFMRKLKEFKEEPVTNETFETVEP